MSACKPKSARSVAIIEAACAALADLNEHELAAQIRAAIDAHGGAGCNDSEHRELELSVRTLIAGVKQD